MKYNVKTFEYSTDVIAWFNDPENADKELISVCVSAPTCCDKVFYAYYKNRPVKDTKSSALL